MTNDARPAGDSRAIRSRSSIAADRGGELIHFSGWADAALIFIGVAIGQGLIGNLTTDALKATFGRLGRHEVPPDPRAPDPDTVFLARSVLNARCAQLGINELTGDDVDAFCMPTSGGLEVLFRGRGRRRWATASVLLSVDEQRADIRAEVRLPETLVRRSRDVDHDAEAVGVLGAAEGWEPLPRA
ncbi:hypothetical protein ONO23_05495 [Micromonospora noduli]|uniref:hypothetical protein n=1 Tax=Micromonospora noduli TaxID=709876 RepID=UPI000DBF909D|nr:hypothetical protein [Micromonospora noduli]RAO26092.1 hypothetical protein ONO23_05495 [Micromonospora noduli]